MVCPRPSKLKAWAYKKFKIGELFSAQTGDTDLQQKDINGKGAYFINSGVEAQGIKGKTDRKAKIFKSNTITIDFWGNAYYRDFEYKMATHNHVFSLSGDIIKNRNIGLYLVSTMSYMKKAFSYNNMGTWTKIKEQCIHLPVTKTGGLDFAFMESRIREMEESRIREMEAYLKVAGFEDCELTEEEWSTLRDFKNHKTRPIVISTIFDIKKGKRLTKDNMIPGTINFIGSTSVNNGVTAKVSNSSHIHNGNTITVTYNGSVGEAFYQTDSYWASDDVNVLTFKRLLNERLALFFCASLRKSGKKYGYTYKWTKELMEKDEIILPVTSSSSIDYKFMETYIRAIEKLTIQRVKDWRAKEIKTTMDIVKDDDTEKSSLQPSFGSKHYEMQEEDVSMMVADNIFIPYSVEVRLWNTKREDLFEGNLDLLLMYAITPSARHKTESACKIALGIKETNLSAEAIKAFKSVRYIMFHYWKNSEATPFELTAPVRLVEKESIPEGFLIRQEKNAKQYLLIEYNSDKPADLGECDILKAQRKGSDRYIPFVCKIGNIKVGNND
ncbi:restriction endonuclease subunit S [Prevotella pectinovora]|uniref:restriction endonuclease subunit S n=1 Tax=Prevotella pectinovora TaxID=1602169 RepID=UPI00352008D3